MVGPDCPLSVVLVALGHSTLGRAKVPALVMGCRRGGGQGSHQPLFPPSKSQGSPADKHQTCLQPGPGHKDSP